MKKLFLLLSLCYLSVSAQIGNVPISKFASPVPIVGFDDKRFDVYLDDSDDKILIISFTDGEDGPMMFRIGLEKDNTFKSDEGFGTNLGSCLMFITDNAVLFSKDVNGTPINKHTFDEGVYLLSINDDGSSGKFYKVVNQKDFLDNWKMWDAAKKDNAEFVKKQQDLGIGKEQTELQKKDVDGVEMSDESKQSNISNAQDFSSWYSQVKIPGFDDQAFNVGITEVLGDKNKVGFQFEDKNGKTRYATSGIEKNEYVLDREAPLLGSTLFFIVKDSMNFNKIDDYSYATIITLSKGLYGVSVKSEASDEAITTKRLYKVLNITDFQSFMKKREDEKEFQKKK